jgi:hypothetical protein
VLSRKTHRGYNLGTAATLCRRGSRGFQTTAHLTPGSAAPEWKVRFWHLADIQLSPGNVPLDSSTSFIAAPSIPGFFSALAGTMTTHTHFTDSIVRVGLNYQFH